MTASALTKALQSIIVNPIIVIKTRLEVVGFNEYEGISDAFKKVYTREGPKAFFTGLQISLIRDVPFAGIFYPIYMFFRTELYKLYDYEMSDKVSKAERFKALALISSISSMMANIVSCSVTHPLDLIRTRAYF